jgi:hypothetical protein
MVELALMESTVTIAHVVQDSLVPIVNLKLINAIHSHAEMEQLVWKTTMIMCVIVLMDLWASNVQNMWIGVLKDPVKMVLHVHN